MTKLYDGQIAELFQSRAKQNPEIQAISYAVLQEKRRIMDEAQQTRTAAMIDLLPEAVLDVLAVELRTPAYSEAFPIDTKRELINGTLNFYMRLGTPAAVNWIIQAAFGNGHILEWFDYEGEPHHFKVTVKNDGTFRTLDGIEEFMRLIAVVKRLSSWLDEIIIETDLGPSTIYMGGQMTAEVRLPLPTFPDSFDFRQTLREGGQLASILRQPIPAVQDSFDFQQEARIGGTLGAVVEHPVPAIQDNIAFQWTTQTGGTMAAVARYPVPPLRDNLAFRQETRAGGQIAAQQTQPIPELKDSLRFKEAMRTGGRITASSTIPIPAEKDSDVTLSHTGRIGVGGCTLKITVPLPELPQ